jgi:L,D-transpeptidase-like protein
MRTMKRFTITLAVAAIGGLAQTAPALAEQPVLRAAEARGPVGNERMSDERTITRVGFPQRLGKIRSAPRRDARTVGHLRFYTEDRAPENYLVLQSKLDAKGHSWLQIRVPKRPNGSKGWVPAGLLGQLKLRTTSFEIDKHTLKAHLFKDGTEIWTSSVGIGASGTPTPSGRYWIRERLSNFGGNSAYGPFAFGTSAYSRLSDWPGGGVIGIHGTNQPGLIPGRPSHGCVRIPNGKLLKLKQLMPVGTPVWIH